MRTRTSSFLNRNARKRRGIATLEFAMSLPTLLALFVLIVWLGASVVGQSQVTVDARHKAWKERFKAGEGEGNPLRFVAETKIERSSETTVDVSPIFAGMSSPKAEHAIFGGSWDHRQIDLNKPPHWDLYTTVGGSSASLSVSNLLGDLGDLSKFPGRVTDALSGSLPIGGGDTLDTAQNLGGLLP